MKIVTLNDGRHYARTPKPTIRKHEFDMYSCSNSHKIGYGYSPHDAWKAWARNILNNLRSPQ